MSQWLECWTFTKRTWVWVLLSSVWTRNGIQKKNAPVHQQRPTSKPLQQGSERHQNVLCCLIRFFIVEKYNWLNNTVSISSLAKRPASVIFHKLSSKIFRFWNYTATLPVMYRKCRHLLSILDCNDVQQCEYSSVVFGRPLYSSVDMRLTIFNDW